MSTKKLALVLVCWTAVTVVAAPAWADQCSNPSIGTGAGTVGNTNVCTLVITVTDGAPFTATITGSGNAYDGDEDQLIGIQNSSTVPVSSIRLFAAATTASSPYTSNLFNFDGDGPCASNAHDCFGPTGYEGPDNTFTNVSTDFTTGTVQFTTPIPAGGSTWFALENKLLPESLANQTVVWIAQTVTLTAGSPATYPVGQNKYIVTPFNSASGDTLTITAFPLSESTFDLTPPSAFPLESCVPYSDFSAFYGAHTCVEFQASCTGSDCGTFIYQLQTDYNLPSDLPAIGGPDLLVEHNVSCTQTTGLNQSIFLSYATGTDPIHSGGSTGTSCYAATWTPTANVIASGTFSTFVGFQSPVSDTTLNTAKSGSTIPLIWVQLNSSGNPVTNLSLCTTLSGTTCTAPAGITRPWVNLQAYSVNGNLCTSDLDVGDNLITSYAGNSGLQNESSTQPGQYQYNWKTTGIPKGTCAEMVFTYDSGTVLVAPAQFQFK
jgi:hypothetical protein